MFRTILIFIIVVSISIKVKSQVAINTNGNLPANSAMLDISASDKGLLIPHVALNSTADTTTIHSPATGLMIYNTSSINDIVPGFYFYNGSEWAPLGSISYTFQNGLTRASNVVGLGGNLVVGTGISLGDFNLKIDLNDTGVFAIQSAGTDKTIFLTNGDVDFKGLISSGGYYNFESVFGASGYGFRERHGNLEYKNDGGIWTAFPTPVNGTAYWWYRPTDSTFIQPQNNDNIRVYDTLEEYGLYFNGAKNQYGGFFRATGSFDPTAAVVGYSDVLGYRTKGYLGYNGRWSNSAGDLTLDGTAVYGQVEDRGRASIFGHTTRDATVAAIIGYSDVWISGYYYTRDEDAYASSHPALYSQLLTGADKSGFQPAIQSWSEYIGGVGNDGYTVGGQFVGYGHEQDSKGIDVYAQSYGSNTEAVGASVTVDSADYIYGLVVDAGNSTIHSAQSYAGIFNNYTNRGTGILSVASNASNVYVSGYGDGLVGVSNNGYGVFGQYDDRSGTISTYGILGYDDTTANRFYHNEIEADGDGQSVAYVERAGTNPGTGYDRDSTNQGIFAVNNRPDSYTFSINGFLKSEGNGRTGAVFGNDYWAWGCLGYEDSGLNDYGGYFTNYATGSGKGQVSQNVGIGVYGDLMGGWIRGNVYGLTLKGDRYSLYVDGQTVTNDVIMNVTDVGEPKKVVTYVPTAENPTLFMSGVGVLAGGKSSINFDEKYKKLIDPDKDIIVTVTPIGESKGLHLVESKSSGFTVAENGSGKSNVKFTWIAIAQRKVNSKPAEEVVNQNFDKLIEGFMFNENDTKNSAQPLWWNGKLQTTTPKKPILKNAEPKVSAEPQFKIFKQAKNHKKIEKPKKHKIINNKP